MSSPALKEEILTELARLPVEKQRTVLQFVRNLASDRPAGARWPEGFIKRFFGSIPDFPEQDTQLPLEEREPLP